MSFALLNYSRDHKFAQYDIENSPERQELDLPLFTQFLDFQPIPPEEPTSGFRLTVCADMSTSERYPHYIYRYRSEDPAGEKLCALADSFIFENKEFSFIYLGSFQLAADNLGNGMYHYVLVLPYRC